MRLHGEIEVPADKSITHRALMLNAVASGKAVIKNPLFSGDILTTINCLRKLGVIIKIKDKDIYITGNGFSGLKQPESSLNCKNSGTTARLFMGLLAGLDFPATLIGDASLSKRPMRRVAEPLSLLNGMITLTDNNYLPAVIRPTQIHGNNIDLKLSSAQVKSALMLAALKSADMTTITMPSSSRNHTELMLEHMGCDIEYTDKIIKISGKKPLTAADITIPGDISAASFFIVSCLIVPGSEILIKNCGLNPTRTGILSVLNQIRASYEITKVYFHGKEAVGDIHIKYQENLQPFTIEGDMVPLLVDEIPVLSLLATQIPGESVIRNAEELRVKESDRLSAAAQNLKRLGAKVIENHDGLTISGPVKLTPNTVDSFMDHRISMMLKVAKLICPDLSINNADVDAVSYPNFADDLAKLIK